MKALIFKKINTLRLIFIYPCLISAFAIMSFPQVASAVQAAIGWNASSGAVAGYDVHYGTTSGNYTTTLNAGDNTSLTLTNLAGQTYYIAVSAYDDNNNHSPLSAELVIDSLSASAGSGGSISPSGSFFQSRGASQTFTITPASGYVICDVKVDGVSVGAVSSFTFSDIAASHTISAAFAAKTAASSGSYTINASAGSGGTIAPQGAVSVNSGASQAFAITPASGYVISDVKVDGVSVGAVSSYTFSDVAAGHTISVAFAAKTVASSGSYTINASAGNGGTIAPQGAVSVNSGTNQTFKISANAGYSVSNVVVDGASLGALTSYTFSDVTATHTIAATFATTNAPPVADAGPDQTVTEGTTVTLNGSDSSTHGGSPITSYQWTQTGGTAVKLSNASAAQPTFVAPSTQTGALTFQLTVKNGNGLTATATSIVNVISNKMPPTASAGPDQTVTAGTLVTLNGSGSTDPNGSTLSYLWHQIDGLTATLSGATSSKPTFTAPQTKSGFGSMSFQLTVTDQYGLKSTDICYVNISPGGKGPQAVTGEARVETAGSVASLDGSSSTDSNGAIASYLWHQAKGSSETLSAPATANPYFTVNDPGQYGSPMVFRLTVQDDNGLRSRAYETIVSKTLWQNASNLGGGWEWLNWFGYFNINCSPWIYNWTLGWLYPCGTSTDSIWFYDPQWNGQGGWWWTSSSVFPWLYSNSQKQWLYFDAAASTPASREFRNPSTGKLVNH